MHSLSVIFKSFSPLLWKVRCENFLPCGSCNSSLHTPKSRLCDKLFTSFIDLPLLFIVQLADRTFILMKRRFSVSIIATRLLFYLSPSVWFSAYKKGFLSEKAQIYCWHISITQKDYPPNNGRLMLFAVLPKSKAMYEMVSRPRQLCESKMCRAENRGCLSCCNLNGDRDAVQKQPSSYCLIQIGNSGGFRCRAHGAE